jgi:hypothetical protein
LNFVQILKSELNEKKRLKRAKPIRVFLSHRPKRRQPSAPLKAGNRRSRHIAPPQDSLLPELDLGHKRADPYTPTAAHPPLGMGLARISLNGFSVCCYFFFLFLVFVDFLYFFFSVFLFFSFCVFLLKFNNNF